MIYDLKHLNVGSSIQINLSGNAANILLMDKANIDRRKQGKAHRVYGGLSKNSLNRMRIPYSGHWFIVIYSKGTTRCSLKVFTR